MRYPFFQARYESSMSSWYMGQKSSSIDPISTRRSRRKNDCPPTAKKQSVEVSIWPSGW